MKVLDAARRFDKMSCRDGYSGAHLFYAQLGLYDDTKRDSETAERRIVSMSADNVIPARRVIECAGTRFILGKGNPDSHGDQSVRVGFVAHEGTHLATVRTLGQFCRNEAGTTAWGGRAWVKDAAFTEQSSDLTPMEHLHFAVTEAIAESYVVQFDGSYYLVRSKHASAAGFLALLVEHMSAPVETATFSESGTYNPITESWSAGTVAVRAIKIRWQGLFQYRSTLAPTFGPDDIQLAIAKTLMTPQVGQSFTLSEGTWRLASVDSEGDVWLCRASRRV